MNKKINLINAFDANGTLRIKKLYTEIFDTIPDRFQYYKEDMLLDTTFFTVEKCKELFGSNIDVLIDSSEQYYSTSKAEEEGLKWNSDQNSFKRTTHPGVTVIHYDEEWIIEIDYNSITCHSHYKNMKPYVDIILNKCPSQEVKSKTATIDLVAFDHSYYTINSKIKRTEIDLDVNYNDDFKKAYNDTLNFLNEQESGLILWYGEKGSGKTSAIRHLLSHTDKKYLLVTNAVASHMAEPEFISFMMDNKDSVFVLEDCEQVLMSREENRFGGAISNILNMSDGLMSDIFNIKFICTFNTSIDNIDEALLRPGRCYVNYEFKPLCEEKTKKLLNSLGHSTTNVKELTLAEIYNYKEEEMNKPVRKKMGF